MMNYRPNYSFAINSFLKLLFLLGMILFLNDQNTALAKTMEHTDNTTKNADPKSKLSLMSLVPSLTPVSDYRGNIWSRPTLFGDLGGKRQELYENGVALDVQLTQVPQGVVSGGSEKGWDYSVTSDYYLFLDTGRLNLWPGGLFGIHAQSKFGRSANGIAGVLSPVNSNALWPSPGPETETFLSEYYLYQGLTEDLVVVLGRLNWVGIADKNRFANSGKTQFLNMSLRNTTLLGAFIPLTAHGIAFAYQPHPNFAFLPFVVSSSDNPAEYGAPDGLFNDVTVGAEMPLSWELNNLPGSFKPGFVYGTKDRAALDNDYLILNRIRGIEIPTKSDNWLVNVNFDQYLYRPENSAEGPRTADYDYNLEGIGVFFRFAHTPEDRNPWNVFVSGGIGGRGVIPSRPNDRYGIGVYSIFASNDLKNQPVVGRLGDEWGLEVFYNLALTPWLQVTPDFQYIQSGLPNVEDSIVVGTRVQMYF